MATLSYKLGAGTLIFDDDQDASAQVTKCLVKASESVKTTDAVPTLDGGELSAEDEATLAYLLEGQVIQDIGAASLVEWTWAHAGESVSWEFVPSTSAGRQASGTCTIVPLDIGGDVKVRNTSDFSYRVPTKPTIGAAV